MFQFFCVARIIFRILLLSKVHTLGSFTFRNSHMCPVAPANSQTIAERVTAETNREASEEHHEFHQGLRGL